MDFNWVSSCGNFRGFVMSQQFTNSFGEPDEVEHIIASWSEIRDADWALKFITGSFPIFTHYPRYWEESCKKNFQNQLVFRSRDTTSWCGSI